jgi:hypothetical protein
MKRILVCGLLAIACIGLCQDKASALCFDVYRPCIRLPLPRLPIFLPNFCIGCDTEGRQSCGGKLLFNKSNCGGYGGGYGYGSGSCGSCGNGGGGAYKCGTPDCNRPMYPNPGWGYNCWNGQVAPWYTYWPPQTNTGYQVGGYGNFRGPAGAGYAAPVQARPAAYAPSYGSGYAQNVPTYWYGR